MESLYAKYAKEWQDKLTIENDKGFVTFFYIPQGVYIETIYVLPEFRKYGEASKLADQVAAIAKEKGHSKMFGSVNPQSTNSTASLKVLLAYGMELDSCGSGGIVLRKEI